MYYLRSRYYNPIWSRFCNADGELVVNIKGICCHLFAYCSNSPVTRIDCDGCEDTVAYEVDDGNPTNDLTGAPKGGPNNYTNTISGNGSNGSNSGKAFSPNIQALCDLAKGFVKTGVNMDDAQILTGWAKEYGVNYHEAGTHPGVAGIGVLLCISR